MVKVMMKGGYMRNRAVLGIVVVAVIAVAIYLLSSGGPVVAAQGYSSLKVQPDQVSININVETRNASAQEAQRQNDVINDRLMAELRARGITDVQLMNFNVYPEYEWDRDGRRRDLGQVARRELVVVTKDFNETAEIVDAVIDAGASVSYINFELSTEKQNEYKSQALEAASKDAKIKAQAIAVGQGRDVGRLVSLTNNDFNYGGPVMYYAREGSSISADNSQAERAALSIAPREMEVGASVTAEYKLSRF